jgi:hypothetical protein
MELEWFGSANRALPTMDEMKLQHMYSMSLVSQKASFALKIVKYLASRRSAIEIIVVVFRNEMICTTDIVLIKRSLEAAIPKTVMEETIKHLGQHLASVYPK